MAQQSISKYIPKSSKRPGVHSKNASRSQSAYKNIYRGQGRNR